MNTTEYDSSGAIIQIVAAIQSRDDVVVRGEVQALWRSGLPLHAIREPTGASSIELALSACVLERLAQIWSSPPRDRPDSPPSWTEHVPALEVEFSVVEEEFLFLYNDDPSPVFANRNILAPKNYLFFL